VSIFIKRPVISIVLSLVICLAGIWAVMKIPVLQFPKIESASLVITTNYTGAAASVVKGFVSEPIERIAATVPGVEYVDSSTVSGQSTVTAWLKLNQDSTRALAELTAKLSQIRFELPADIEDPVISISRTDRPFAVFYLNVHAKEITRSALTDYLTRQVNPILNTIEGIQRVGIEGGRTPAMRIWLDTAHLAAFNLSAQEVYAALQTNNTIATIGYAENNRHRIDLTATTQLKHVDEFENLVISKLGDSIIRLKDVAKVELAAEDSNTTARLNQDDTVYISIWPLPGANEIAIGDKLYATVEKLNQSLPEGVRIDFAYDGTLYMRDALKEIMSTLAETILLVGIVVLLLMGSFKTSLVPLVTIPISILGAIAAMSLMGFSLNLLTVLAIILSVGLVVDDSIIVVENVAHFMRQGMSRTEAALRSSRQLLIPIISMTLTLAAVYLPIGFLTGLTGVLFKEFAFTLAIAVLISGVVAITLSPIMSAYILPKGGEEGFFTVKVNNGFDSLRQGYAKLLQHIFNWKNQILLMAVVFSVLAMPFYLSSAKELAPTEDQSSIILILQSPPDASLAYNVENTQEIVNNLLTIPDSTEMWQVVQNTGGFSGLELVSPKEREHTTQEMLPSIYERLSSIAGLNPLPILPSSLPTAGQFDVEFVVKSSASYEEMKPYADKLVEAAYQSGEFLFADTDHKIDLPQIKLTLNREKIADLGMSISDVSKQLEILLSNNYVNRFDAKGKAYRVIPIIDGDIRKKPENIINLNIKIPSGELIPVSAIAKLNWIATPRKLGTFGQQNAFRIFGGITSNTTKEKALSALEQAAATILPKSYNIDYAGESRQLRQEGNTLIIVLLVSLLIVYLILAIQFNSFRDPFIVLVGCVPLALSSALLLPFIELTTINIYSQIGLITLIGLITKNGILIVEFAKNLQEQGYNKLTAITDAATSRLRPILMTTAATVLGHFPLVLVTGAGAEARNSIGIILVSGMLIGTIFTLFVLPVFYLLLAKQQKTDTEEKTSQASSISEPILLTNG